MARLKGSHKKTASYSTLLLLTVGLLIPIAISQKALASYGQTSDEIITLQEPEPIKQEAPKQVVSVDQDKLKKFTDQVKEYNNGKIAKLRGTNQRFSIAFIVAGITLTLVSTALGAVESQNPEAKKWTKFAIVGLGAGAVAAQALNSAFPVTKRAAVYAGTESELTILEFKAEDITTQDELNKSKEEFYNLIRSAGNAEAQDDQPKKK